MKGYKFLTVIFVFLTVIVFLIHGCVSTQIKRVDTIGKMTYALGNLDLEEANLSSMNQIEIARLIHKRCPKIKLKENRIVDEWGNSIHIIVRKIVGTQYSLEAISCGPDGKSGTKDDLFRELSGTKKED